MNRKAHATLNILTRINKAQKIEILLNLKPTQKSLRILEVGCGSGGIAHYFATHKILECQVSAVDIYDNRVVSEHYDFKKVTGVKLPFDDNSFDIIITNHVIEHVGDNIQQLIHIQEIKRVLASNGQCYLAVPNRWMLTEPHYGLKFLSWLPKKFRTFYLKLWRKGNYYDCEPLSLPELETILLQANVNFQNISVEATKVTLMLEKPHSLLNYVIQKFPNSLLAIFKPIIPTLIYKFSTEKIIQKNTNIINTYKK